jgi:hypothetical protein
MFMAVQIQNLSTFLVKNNAGPQFDIQPQWFMVQRKIISEVYPDFPDPDTFRIYLYLCKHFDHSDKRCKRSKERICIDLDYAIKQPGALRLMNYPREVNFALAWLENNKFIRRTNSNSHQPFQCEILTAPDFVPGINAFIGLTNVNYEWYSLKDSNHGYVMAPNKAFDDRILKKSLSVRKTWTNRKLKTLLMLYAHTWLEYFGGVDPDIVSIDSSGMLIISEWFCCNLKSSEKQVGDVIVWLVSRGLLKPVECYFVHDVYYGDVGRCSPPAQTYDIKIVLRPYYLIQHKIESDLMKLKKGRMIL